MAAARRNAAPPRETATDAGGRGNAAHGAATAAELDNVASASVAASTTAAGSAAADIGVAALPPLQVLPPLRALHELAPRARALRFYVYEPPAKLDWSALNLTARWPKCKTFQWSGDWELSARFGSSAQRTRNGAAADFFVVPFLSKCYYNYAAKYKLKRMGCAMDEVLRFLGAMPWWAARPERHVFFFMSGIGAGIVPTWRERLERAIFVVAEGDRQAEYFRYGHDIVVPGKLSVKPLRYPPGSDGRRLLAVFRGGLFAALRNAEGGRVKQPNKLRRWLAKLLADTRGVIFSGHKSDEYVAELDGSRFCIIPRGNTPWTRRFFDAAVRGCIPVVLSDPISFPFEMLLDYTQMTLKLPEEWAPRLAAELQSANVSSMRALQGGLRRHWPAFVYEGGCAFELLLIELAARKHGYFARYAPATRNSATQFWTPARGDFALASAKKVGPSWGAGAVAH